MSVTSWIKSKVPGRRKHFPERDTRIYPTLALLGQPGNTKRPLYKPVPRNLRYFSKTIYAQRAIAAIKNPILGSPWEIRPKAGVAHNSEIDRQIAAVTASFLNPNPDDSFASLMEAVITDICLGAGVIEQQLTGNPERPLALFPVDTFSIQIYPLWDGTPGEPRYAQAVGYSNYGTVPGQNAVVKLRNDELIYMRPNPSTGTPFGQGPLETAFQSIARKLGVEEYAGLVAGNASPSILVHLGENADEAAVATFRNYFESDIEGQGKTPFIGGALKPEVLNLRPGGDAALFLAYQELLIQEIATAFCLDPANMGLSKSQNRDTSEAAADRDWDHAIRPMAILIASYLNREAIAGKLGFSQIEMVFKGLDRKDEKASADIFQTYYRNNIMCPDEIREQLGMLPSGSIWGTRFKADADIATMAARGIGLVDDPGLPGLNEDSDEKLQGDMTKDRANSTPVPRSKQGPTPPRLLPANPLKEGK